MPGRPITDQQMRYYMTLRANAQPGHRGSDGGVRHQHRLPGRERSALAVPEEGQPRPWRRQAGSAGGHLGQRDRPDAGTGPWPAPCHHPCGDDARGTRGGIIGSARRTLERRVAALEGAVRAAAGSDLPPGSTRRGGRACQTSSTPIVSASPLPASRWRTASTTSPWSIPAGNMPRRCWAARASRPWPAVYRMRFGLSREGRSGGSRRCA